MNLNETTWKDVDEAMDFAVTEIAKLREENKNLKARLALSLSTPLLLTKDMEIKDGHKQVEVNCRKD